MIRRTRISLVSFLLIALPSAASSQAGETSPVTAVGSRAKVAPQVAITATAALADDNDKVAGTATEAPVNEVEATTASTGAPADDSQELAKKLANPVSSLISVPFQTNLDFNIGPDRKGKKQTVNFQPVVPIELSDEWTIISRTIVPIVHQHDIFPGAGSQFGLSDTLQSFFFTPLPKDGFIWAVGPAILLPTGTDKLLTTKKWGAGPTAVVLKQSGPITVGSLANHIWSVAGSRSRPDVSQTFVQPFISYTTKTAVTFSVVADYTHDWKADTNLMPLTIQVSKLTSLGKQPISVGAALRYYAVTHENSPHGLAARLNFVLLFPTN